MKRAVLFLLTIFQPLMCPGLIVEYDPRYEEGDHGIAWEVFPKEFMVAEIRKWKRNSDVVKQTRKDWQGQGYDHECIYCCLYQGDCRCVYKKASELKKHYNSQLHQKAVKVIGSNPVAKYFYDFHANAQSMTPKELMQEIMSASRPNRKKRRVDYGS